MEALEVRVDFTISMKQKSSPITTIRSPSVIEKTPPDIMLKEKMTLDQGSTPPPRIPSRPRL